MKAIKRILSISIILLSIGLIMEGFAYVNLMTSEKYEAQPTGIAHTGQEIERADIRKQEITHSKKRTIIEGSVILILLIVLIVIAYRVWNSKNINLGTSDIE